MSATEESLGSRCEHAAHNTRTEETWARECKLKSTRPHTRAAHTHTQRHNGNGGWERAQMFPTAHRFVSVPCVFLSLFFLFWFCWQRTVYPVQPVEPRATGALPEAALFHGSLVKVR